ncbi:zinc finger protein 226-like [Ischnura elegans]|uniref:zinc finger protein 226-like n=1 Tax=Ischnura elegans TaxID=197161 RepID=UPI001ED8A45F|nr:zinc finger protein 226-like [Ischnura elegans]
MRYVAVIMGGLRCTLCCGETFRTPLELAKHLEAVLGNIECACCGLKFTNSQNLLDHYKTHTETENDYLKEASGNEEPPKQQGDMMEEAQMKAEEEVDPSSEDTVTAHSDEDMKPDLSSLASSLIDLSSAMNVEFLKGDSGIVKEKSFHCSCGMYFDSLEEHLMVHHFGQEVTMLGDAEEIETLLSNKLAASLEDKVVVSNQEAKDFDADHKEAEPEVIVCNRNADEGVLKAEPSPTPLLTPSQIEQLDGKVEECVDKDGRVYLRKFVRVKKFWSEKDEVHASQMKTKVRDYDTIRDVPVGSVSIKSKDEAVTSSLSGEPKRLYQCSECEKTFQTMIHFKYHVCSVKHGAAMTCNLCGHESTSNKDLRAHWRMHQRQRRVAATALWELQAGEGVSTNGNVGANEETPEIQCERCGEVYPKSEELVHVAMHDEEPPHNCQKCSETFDSREKLSRHMKSHKEPKTHSCSFCGKSFVDSNAYKLHVRTHTGEKPYECQYCEKRFSRPYERMKHERIHTGERPHVCEICGKTFRVSYCLTLHKRTHSGDRPYTCDTCGKRFKAHSAYKHHVQIHSDVRKYQCPFCPKAFKTMVHLSGHKKTHTKPFLCSECNRRFASLYSMKAHMESHKTGKNSFRYRCFVCGASYARSFALHAHLMTHGPSDAPEDVAEVLEIHGEDQKRDIDDDNDDDRVLLVDDSGNIDLKNEVCETEVGAEVVGLTA